ncbi:MULTISPECIES: hypothetical protein [Bacillus cereus group]|uniref:hypothetical protein n=1 Tax=Bacillus cereus group TaxID=86661 RepID=UPI000BF42962|nr:MULTISPECIES: hypothetical protein [Bacillus cereus group]MED1555679.1 hypothetical protein [Bacillus paramycoides]PEP84914.1 hypothetical protein CN584_13620 [Bacillus pseudomycoides]
MNKESFNLSFPHTLFINCTGSYILSIFDYFSKQKNNIDVLYFLTSYKLKYTPLIVEETKDKYNGNPWGFQLVKVYDKFDNPLFKGDTFIDFLSYLKGNFNILSNVISNREDINIIDYIVIAYQNGKIPIVSIDEFYNPNSPSFYNIKHNSHSILIKGVNYREQTVDVIDTESPSNYNMKFDDLRKCCEYSPFNNYHMVFYCDDYINLVNKGLDKLSSLINEDFINLLRTFINGIKFYDQNHKCDKEFIHNGIHFSILFQIIPFIKMRNDYINSVVHTNTINGIQELSDIVFKTWMNLSYIMLRNKHSNQFSLKAPIEFLEKIVEVEKKLYDNLHSGLIK